MDQQHQDMRASDKDRDEVVVILRAALDDGRLKMDEYLERVGQTEEALTYRDLAAIHADLPKGGQLSKPGAASEPVTTAHAVVSALTPQPANVALPTALKVLWTIWAAIVSLNVVIWLLVDVTNGELVYPWPVWVAGPSGAVLFAISSGVRQIQQSRRNSAAKRLPPTAG